MKPGIPEPDEIERIRTASERALEEYLQDLRTLVDIDCGTYLPDGVNRVVDHLEQRFRSEGWTLERVAHDPPPASQRLGDLLVATVNGDGGHRVLLVGHTDTVFPDGTAAARPFRVEGGRAFGPGVSDMKGGLLLGLYAVRALREANAAGFASVTYVCNPDEEIGSPWSGPEIVTRARSADACFVLEAARENGDIVSARKGVVDVRLIVHGRAAHAGVEPERGRSAALQAAHTTIALHELNGRWPGVTVNVGVIEGGTRPNVITERCELHVDVRAPTTASLEAALEAVADVAGATVVPDTTIELQRQSGFPAMEKTEATAALVSTAKAIADTIGFEVRDAATGGASDANPVAGMGVPTLDGLGPIGGGDHSPGEWLDLESIVPRTVLLAGLIASGS